MHPKQNLNMAIISKPKLSFMAFSLLILTLVHSQDDDVTSFAYYSFDPDPNQGDPIYQGGAHVPLGSRFVRLTETDLFGNPRSWSTGRVVYPQSVPFWQKSPARQATFETTINFRIKPSPLGAADGLAFYISPFGDAFDVDSSGPNFGIFNDSAGGTAPAVFAVEFDTFANDAWDPNYRHVGIDIESRESKNTTMLDSATGELVSARINYDPYAKNISVVATSGSRTASVSYAFDLKTVLPQDVEMGISASTGQTTSYLGVHDLISWYFTSTLVNDDETYINQFF